MSKTYLMAIIMAAMISSPAVLANSHKAPETETPREMIEEATRQILKAFEIMLKAIPQYAAPEILDNGDIIIRRKHPKKDKPSPKPGNGDPTKTKT